MIAYIDSSALVRIILRQPSPLEDWNSLKYGVSSALLLVECNRTFDQLWHRGELTEADVLEKRALLLDFLPRLDIRPIDARVLDVASQPFPTPLATLDALHLATAILYRATQPPDEQPLVFATHDRQLAVAAQAFDFRVVGTSV